MDGVRAATGAARHDFFLTAERDDHRGRGRGSGADRCRRKDPVRRCRGRVPDHDRIGAGRDGAARVAGVPLGDRRRGSRRTDRAALVAISPAPVEAVSTRRLEKSRMGHTIRH
jgi:hypothetical protein